MGTTGSLHPLSVCLCLSLEHSLCEGLTQPLGWSWLAVSDPPPGRGGRGDAALRGASPWRRGRDFSPRASRAKWLSLSGVSNKRSGKQQTKKALSLSPAKRWLGGQGSEDNQGVPGRGTQPGLAGRASGEWGIPSDPQQQRGRRCGRESGDHLAWVQPLIPEPSPLPRTSG